MAARDVAQDVNSLLAVIAVRAEMIAKGVGGPGGVHESVQIIQSSAARAAAMTRQLLASGEAAAMGKVRLKPDPTTERMRPDAATAPLKPDAATEARVILVVDRDDVMRELTVKLLRSQGYRVLAARTIEEGGRFAAEPIALLVSDVVRDGSRWDDATAALMAAHPTMKLVCIVGGGQARALPLHDCTRATLLERPFSSPMLAASVRAMLQD